jgi:nicotinamide mononucleotide transporter
MAESFIQYWSGLFSNTGWVEYLAVLAGILSVFLSVRESVWLYPVGLFNTCLYVYISLQAHLPGEALVNSYYTIMSLAGWYAWSRKGEADVPLLKISFSTRRQVQRQVLFFLTVYGILFVALQFSKESFFPGAIPWADALASGAAFTAMWLMNQKKIECWYWWILTNLVSIPLYAAKGLALTGIYYFILLLMAISGWQAWNKTLQSHER